MNYLLPSFARYTAAKQNMHTNGLVYHMLTLLQKQADKSSRLEQLFTSASGSESQSCAATILTKKKACLATSLSKLVTILNRNPCFARTIVALDRLLSPQRWLPFCSSLFLKLLTYLHCDMHAVYLIRCFAIVCSEGS